MGQKYKLLLHCGNVEGQRRLHEGKEGIKGAFLAENLLSSALRALGRYTTWSVNKCVGIMEALYVWGRGWKEDKSS